MTVNDIGLEPERILHRSLWRTLLHWHERRLAAIAETVRRRQAMWALHRLDDRMLADIGIARGEIEQAVRGDAARPKPIARARADR